VKKIRERERERDREKEVIQKKRMEASDDPTTKCSGMNRIGALALRCQKTNIRTLRKRTESRTPS
jgi:hypothetical protein